MPPRIRTVRITRLAKVRVNRIKLSPADGHAIRIRRINGDGGLVGRVADNVVAVRIDIDLYASVGAVLDDCRRSDPARAGHVRQIDRLTRADWLGCLRFD